VRQIDTDATARRDHDPRHGTANGTDHCSGAATARTERTSAQIATLLGSWQRAEVRLARGFPECRGLGHEQLEDLYQETVIALLTRHYADEEHLRNALRHGIKHRALNVHRDSRRRGEILVQNAPSMQRLAEGRASQAAPENAALLEQDRLIVKEFLTELEPLERQVFSLMADGMRYRAIAVALQILPHDARTTVRFCERKRERFQLLYDTGRLCGYRASTIQALQDGQFMSEELAHRAFAHLDSCPPCRAEHKTNAQRLRRAFRGQAAALLPLPALLRHTGRLWASLGRGAGGVRERGVALVVSAGAGAKITAAMVTVAVVAGGTIGATHTLGRHPTPRPSLLDTRPVTAQTEGLLTEALTPQSATGVHLRPPHTKRERSHSVHIATRREPPALGSVGAIPEAPRREFSPEATTSTPASSPNLAASSGSVGPVTAEREFGIPAAAP
jgi:RNA polymerase sigma factor (sigma-70 family)